MTLIVNAVTRVSAAPTEQARAHFARRLELETDCADVHSTQDLGSEARGFVLLDVRSRSSFAAGHLPGAVSLPTREIEEETLASYSKETLFVVYCAGPHCNGANKAALRLARLGRPVKEMIGGVRGWLDEGFELVSGR